MKNTKGLSGGGAEEGSKDRNSRRRGKKRKINDGRKEKSDKDTSVAEEKMQ
jgi:hypothetical protein